MFEFVKKSILAGIGAAVVTKEKIEEATKHLVKEGKISTDEAEKLTDDLVKSGERQVDELGEKIAEGIKKWADNVEIVRKKEFQELSARVDKLEQRLSTLTGTQNQPSTEL